MRDKLKLADHDTLKHRSSRTKGVAGQTDVTEYDILDAAANLIGSGEFTEDVAVERVRFFVQFNRPRFCTRPTFGGMSASGRGCVKTPTSLARSMHSSIGSDHEAIRRWRGSDPGAPAT